jgi:hypothetical protein
VDGNGFQQVNLLLRKTHKLEGNPRDLIAMHLATSRLLYQRCGECAIPCILYS